MLRGELCPQTSCFCAAQFLTAYCWGLASDRIGRKVSPGPRAPFACDGNLSCNARSCPLQLSRDEGARWAAKSLPGACGHSAYYKT